jgi:DNA-binding HxlR family transcriptional regulator
MDSGQVGPVLGPSGWSGTAGEPGLLVGGTAGEPALRAGETADGSGTAGEPWPDGDPSGLVEPCSEAGFAELADESCLAVASGDDPCLALASADDPCLALASADQPSSCRAREVLARVGDKWSVYVIDLLGQDTKRFTALHRSIDGITARMLTVTLRGLERDGIVTRTIHPVIPPRVEYALTPMGQTLLTTIGQLVVWADGHVSEIEAARAAYDARHQPSLG